MLLFTKAPGHQVADDDADQSAEGYPRANASIGVITLHLPSGRKSCNWVTMIAEANTDQSAKGPTHWPRTNAFSHPGLLQCDQQIFNVSELLHNNLVHAG